MRGTFAGAAGGGASIGGRVVVSGSTGLIGRHVVSRLRDHGYTVNRLVRHDPRDSDIFWDPADGVIDADSIEGCDAVVNLAGRPITSGAWTHEVKAEIRSSRVDGTRLLCEALAGLNSPPKTIISASATGYYGNRGDEELTETSSSGGGFLAELCRDWELATQPAAQAGIRVALLRIGVVLSCSGGALAALLPLYRLGLGGPVGSGNQWMSWVGMDDLGLAVEFILGHEEVCGPVNAVSPEPATGGEFAVTIGKVLRRPTYMRVPAFAVRMAMGQKGEELLLGGARVLPMKLMESGFVFSYPRLKDALNAELAKPRKKT